MFQHKLPKTFLGFTVIEVTVAVLIVALMSTIVYLLIRPAGKIARAQYLVAANELAEIGKALGFFVADNGYYPADVVRNIPPGIEAYINPEDIWPAGPLPGSVYDYDNWDGQTCIDTAASNSIQITLRQIPGKNPDGSNVWAWYYVLKGKGTPHCSSSSEWDKGECINCPGFDPFWNVE